MDKKCVLILGGARSGKSRFAQEWGSNLSERVLFVATAEALDEDMRVRIEKHQRGRPGNWRTLEASIDVAGKLKDHLADAEVVIIDCLTLLVSNLMLGEGRGFSQSDEINTSNTENQVMTEIEGLIDFVRNTNKTFIIVSNEVGLGLVPENRPGRIYRDLLGRVNQLVAEYADEVYFMIAGIPMKVKG